MKDLFLRCDDCNCWVLNKEATYYKESEMFTAAVCKECRLKRRTQAIK